MKYIEAPERWRDRAVTGDGPGIFLAGGITGCPDWQYEVTSALKATREKVTVLNPRREDFPIDDPSAASAQINWEFHHLHMADVILFWFPASDSPQPIALYELGRWAGRNEKPITVGCDSDYPRRRDVYLQMHLARPKIIVHETLEATVLNARILAKAV